MTATTVAFMDPWRQLVRGLGQCERAVGGPLHLVQAGKDDRQETVIATARSGSDDPGLSRPGQF